MSINKCIHSDLLNLVETGAGISLDAGERPVHEICSLATAARRAGGTLTVAGASRLIQSDLLQIAQAGGANVTLKDQPLGN